MIMVRVDNQLKSLLSIRSLLTPNGRPADEARSNAVT